LGLNEGYVDYTSKITAYYNYLVRDEKKYPTRNENDIILLVDAYDVLFFPQIRHVDQVLLHSKTPIIFCSESGIYPEFAGSFFPVGHASLFFLSLCLSVSRCCFCFPLPHRFLFFFSLFFFVSFRCRFVYFQALSLTFLEEDTTPIISRILTVIIILLISTAAVVMLIVLLMMMVIVN
jgi:hypothetical protein